MFLDDLLNGSRKQLSAPLADVLLFSKRLGLPSWPTCRCRCAGGTATPTTSSRSPTACTWWRRLPDAELHVLPGESHLGGLGVGEEILTTLVDVGEVPPSNPGRRSSDQLEPDGPTA